MLFQNHTMPLRRVFASGKMDPSDEEDTEAADVPFPNADELRKPIDGRTFTRLNRQGRADYRHQYRRALRRWAPPGVRLALLPSPDDRWMQDFYEPGYVSMPKPNGRQHVMSMVLRSATKNRGNENPPPGHLMRQGSRIVYSHLRGPGVGVVQAYDPRRMRGLADPIDSMSSTGNFEAIPPYSHGGQHFPDGRPIYGEGGKRKPDPNFIRMLRAQGTRPLVVDTSWLTVGHVDEFVSFVPNDSKRGWTIAVEDPHAGLSLLKRLKAEGHGRARVFPGFARVGSGYPPKPVPATRTVDSLLAQGMTRHGAQRAATRGQVSARHGVDSLDPGMWPGGLPWGVQTACVESAPGGRETVTASAERCARLARRYPPSPRAAASSAGSVTGRRQAKFSHT